MLHKEKTNCKQIMLRLFHCIRKLKIIPVLQNGFSLQFRGIQDITIFTHDAFTKTVTASHGFSDKVEPTPLCL